MRIGIVAGGAALAFFALSTATPVVSAESSISVPCPRWNVGDSWETKAVDDYGTETVSSIVKSRDGARIVVAEKRSYQMTWQDPRAARRPLPPPSITNSETTFEISGKDLRVRQQVGDVVQLVFEPTVPFCGQVPTSVKYQTKSAVMGGSTKGQGAINFRSLGRQTVTVPAGTFEVVVVEGHNQLSAEPSTEGGASTNSVTTRIFFAEGVGAVKTVLGSKVSAPVMSPSGSSQAGAVLKEGIEKLAKGDDVSGAMNKVAAQGQSVQMHTETFEATRTTELTAYRAAK